MPSTASLAVPQHRFGASRNRARYYDADLGRFLQTDPIGYADQMNLYAYVGNDPLGATDPTGMRQDAHLGSRPAGAGFRHLYVAVDEPPEPTIYSGGPSTGAGVSYLTGNPELRPMANVQATDAVAFGRDRNDPTRVVPFGEAIPNAVVHAVARAALGHPDYDTGVRNTRSGQDGANSNSFAIAIRNVSAEIVGVDPASIPIPQGNHPLVGAADRIQFDPDGLQEAREIWQGIVSERTQEYMGCSGPGNCPQ